MHQQHSPHHEEGEGVGSPVEGRKEEEEEKSRGREEGEKEKKKEGRNHTTTVSAGTTPIYTKTWTLSCKCSHTKNLCVFQEPRQTLHATLAFLCRTSSQLVPLKNPNSFSSSELVRKWEYTQFSPILTSTHTLIPRPLPSFSSLVAQNSWEGRVQYLCSREHLTKMQYFTIEYTSTASCVRQSSCYPLLA